MYKRFTAPLLGLMVFGLTACASTRQEKILPGIFNNDFKLLFMKYQLIDNLKLEKVYRENLEGMGFDFSGPNMKRVPGADVFQRIFGDAIFQSALLGKDPAEIENVLKGILEEMNRYYAYWIPFRDVTTVQDKIYFSRKNTAKTGNDLLVIFVFRREPAQNGEIAGDLLIYHDHAYVNIDEKDSTYSFAGGLLDAMDRYGAVTGGASAITDYVKRMFKKEPPQ